MLANAIAQEVNTHLHVYNAANVKQDGLYSIVGAVKKHDILFLDEIHRLDNKMQESLYTIMDSGRLDVKFYGIVLEELKIPPFTLIGATTSTVTNAMLNRFAYVFEVQEYTDGEIGTIVSQYSGRKKLNIKPEELSPYCRGNPRIAHNIIDWIDHYCTVNKVSYINEKVIQECLRHLNIGPIGLTKQDLDYLDFLYQNRRPMGVNSIASFLNVDKNLIETKIEPYLIRRHLVLKTSSGRIVNRKRYEECVMSQL